jgi:hypothetical protein
MLAAPYANVNDALKSKREAVGSVFVERRRVEDRAGFGWTRGGGCEAVDEAWVLWWGGGEAVVVQHSDETLETAVLGHYLSDPG